MADDEFDLNEVLLDGDVEMEKDELQQELELMEEEEYLKKEKAKIKSGQKPSENPFIKYEIKPDNIMQFSAANSKYTKKQLYKNQNKVKYDDKYIDSRVNLRKLFKPLNLDKDINFSLAGREIAYRLEEKKVHLIGHVVRVLGHSLAMEIFEETKKVLKQGGLKTDVGDRNRSPGGTFLYLMKSRGYASTAQTKEIFREDEEIKKSKHKDMIRRNRIKSQYTTKQNDLRQHANFVSNAKNYAQNVKVDQTTFAEK